MNTSSRPTSSWRPGTISRPPASIEQTPMVAAPSARAASSPDNVTTSAAAENAVAGTIDAVVAEKGQPTILGKRSIHDVREEEVPDQDTAPLAGKTPQPGPSSASSPQAPVPTPVKPDLLALPLPSQRFKKSSRNLLFPPELLPAYPLPPLPPIADPVLRAKVFTHESLFAKEKGKFEEEEGAEEGHYEKLEHVGDSILGMVVTTWLHEVHPRLTCGTATKLKAHLVSNATLSHLSTQYQFPQQLRGDPGVLPVLRAETDIRAAMLEAYIAAVYFSYPSGERLSKALHVIDSWLRTMFQPLLDYFYDHMKLEYQLHSLTGAIDSQGNVVTLSQAEMSRIDSQSQGMLLLLKMYCQQQERRLQLIEEKLDSPVGWLWLVKCLVDGIEVGEAVRAGKKQARNVAAWEGAKKLKLTDTA